MKPLIVLVLTTVIALAIIKLIKGVYDFSFAARIGMSVMLLFTALGHFIYTEGMMLMIPESIPGRKELVYFTGIIEVFAAVGLHVAQFRTLTAWLLIAFFILMLPSNIYAAIERVDYQKATYHGKGITYLWFRIPLQVLFILWVYFSAIRFK